MLLATLVLAAAASSSAPDGVRATARPAKTEVTVGETMAVEVAAEGPPGTSFTFPERAGNDQVELTTPLAPSPPPPATHRYQALVLTLSETEVPSVPVRYRLPDGREGDVQTAPVALRVVSLLPKDPQEQKLAEIQGPLSLSLGRAFWVALLALLGVGGLFLFWVLKRRRRQPAAPEVPALAPDQEALLALDELAASSLLARGQGKAFYIALTAIAKRYLERRLQAPVLEMTTAEMIAFLRESPPAGKLLPVLKDLAGAADQIKFAGGREREGEGERHLAGVRDLILALEARMSPPPAEAA